MAAFFPSVTLTHSLSQWIPFVVKSDIWCLQFSRSLDVFLGSCETSCVSHSSAPGLMLDGRPLHGRSTVVPTSTRRESEASRTMGEQDVSYMFTRRGHNSGFGCSRMSTCHVYPWLDLQMKEVCRCGSSHGSEWKRLTNYCRDQQN